MAQRVLKVIAAVGVVALVGTACSSSGDSTGSGTRQATNVTRSSDATTNAQVGSPATELRVALSSLLQADVYLTGLATGAAVIGDDPALASAALDANTVKLGDEVGSIWGTAAANQFLVLWRTHSGFFLDYANAAARHDAAGMATARSDLDGYRSAFGAFISAANPNLPKEAVAAELVPHNQTLLAAIDAQVAKDPSRYATLAAAAEHMSMTAELLANGIAKQFPEKFGRGPL